jgi:CRP-like cAMP-binding protein
MRFDCGEEKPMSVYDVAKQSNLLHGLTDDAVQMIVDAMEIRDYNGGQVLVRQFERSNDLFFILDGKVSVSTYKSHGEKITELSAPAVIGEVALMDDGPRSATVTSAGKTRVGVIAADKLKELVRYRPQMELTLLRNLCRILCAHIREMNM